MEQSTNNYPTGNLGGSTPSASHSSVPSDASGTSSLLQQQQQHCQKQPQQHSKYLQHQPFANQHLQQQQQRAPQQQPRQPQQHALKQAQSVKQAPQRQQQQFVPGPFYNLQQQQAFAQARLAAAQAQQQQAHAQQQAQAQVSDVPRGIYTNYSLAVHQQLQTSTNATTVGGESSVHSPSPALAAALSGTPITISYQANTATRGPTPGTAVGGPQAPMMTNKTTAATEVLAPTTTRKRKSPELKSTPGPKNKSSQSPPSARKTKTAKVGSKKSGASGGRSPIPPPQATSFTTSGMSSSAARLIQNAMAESNACDIPAAPASASPSSAVGSDPAGSGSASGRPLTAEEKKQTSRDRNREHARCTRLRKKAYVNKLKELVDGLHAERSEDARKRRVAVQHLAEIQELRRKVVHTFLGYHSRYEKDVNKWNTILEKDFWLKQPVTPYRSFRRCEVQKGSCILKGVDAMIRDSASMSVMIETIGSRNLRWLQRKRDDFLTQEVSKHHGASARLTHRISHACGSSSTETMPHSIVRQSNRLQHAVSSLSSSSGASSGNGSGSEEEKRMAQHGKAQDSETKQHDCNSIDIVEKKQGGIMATAKKVSSSSSSNGTVHQLMLRNPPSKDFHDYHAAALEDPLPESGGSSPSSQDVDSDNCVVGASSGEEDKAVALSANTKEKRKLTGCHASTNIVRKIECGVQSKRNPPSASALAVSKATGKQVPMPNLPPNIAKSGGILHNVKAVAQWSQPNVATTSSTVSNSMPGGRANLSRAPVTALPPFVGIGKKKNIPTAANKPPAPRGAAKTKPLSFSEPNPPIPSPSKFQNNSEDTNIPQPASHHYSHRSSGNIITIDNDTGETASSKSFSQTQRGIQAQYHINEDDMILTDDVLMCPFIFRSQEAVWCGALSECVQPGMLRACFSPTNKLKNVEMIFDSMGFCQQLERASGGASIPQIIPNSLEMALAPNSDEARVITLAKMPFRIVSVNEAWTSVTGYTQLNAEGKDLLSILEGGAGKCGATGGSKERNKLGSSSVRSPYGEEKHNFESVARGICTASTNVHRDVNGREFLNFMCSYPLSNLSDEVTHILHVCRELPERT